MMRFLILSLFLMTVLGCDKKASSQNEDTNASPPAEKGGSSPEAEDVANKIFTVTVRAELNNNESVSVTDGKNTKSLSSSNQCVIVRGDLSEMSISLSSPGSKVSTLCSNKDPDKQNDCVGSYDIIYTTADASTGANKLALSSPATGRNESEACEELFPVYTITLKSGIGDRTVKVNNSKVTKILQTRNSCLKLKSIDYENLQIDVGQTDEDRSVLCGSSIDYLPCEANKNFEIDKYGRPPEPDTLTINQKAVYNQSRSCEWLSGP